MRLWGNNTQLHLPAARHPDDWEPSQHGQIDESGASVGQLCTLWTQLTTVNCCRRTRGDFWATRVGLPLRNVQAVSFKIHRIACRLTVIYTVSTKKQNRIFFKLKFRTLNVERRTLVFDRWAFAVLRSTHSWRVTTYVGKPSAIGQPTRPTQPFILSWSINE